MHSGNCCEKAGQGWPESWHEVKRADFSARVKAFELIPDEHVPTMARSIENLGAEVQDMIDYLTKVKVAQRRLAAADVSLNRTVDWSLRTMSPFQVTIKDRVPVALLKTVVVILLFAPLWAFNVPPRLLHRFKIWRIMRGMTPSFMEFLAERKGLA